MLLAEAKLAGQPALAKSGWLFAKGKYIFETIFGRIFGKYLEEYLAGQPAKASSGQPGVLLLSTPASPLPNFLTYFQFFIHVTLVLWPAYISNRVGILIKSQVHVDHIALVLFPKGITRSIWYLLGSPWSFRSLDPSTRRAHIRSD